MGRQGAGYVRYLLACFRRGELKAEEGAEELGISACWFRHLYAEYLGACAEGHEEEWQPGKSGGAHHKAQIPAAVAELWRKLLTSKPPAAYSFAASEAERRCSYLVDRATVRRWALTQSLAHPRVHRRERTPVRRWQCQEAGALWQLDVSPHHWFGKQHGLLPLYDMVDDCSRLMTGTWLYPRECLLAYLDFLRRAFEAYGLPVALYVDFHSYFFTAIPDNLTYLGEALRFYDISFKYASTPQAKGKIERQHQFWQNRLPCYFAAEGIDQIDGANHHIEQLRLHHNRHEVHRELQMTPQEAWDRACQEKRCVLRPRPPSAWWPFIWSIRVPVRVGIDSTVPVGASRLKTHLSPFSKVIRCEHPDGSFTFLAQPPGSGGKPIVLLRYEHHGTPSWRV